jgi:cytochrome oxidase Cu insertion factor (SCO1/SenC/PrrC family)
MKKLVFILIFSFCSSSSATQDIAVEESEDIVAVSSTTLTYLNQNGEEVIEDLTNKKTLIVFWADY